MNSRLNFAINHFDSNDESKQKKTNRYLQVVRNELIEEAGGPFANDLDLNIALSPDSFNEKTGNDLLSYLDVINKKYLNEYNLAIQKKEKLIYAYENTFKYNLHELKNVHYNESLADLVRNLSAKDRVLEFKGKLLQIVEPVFNVPSNPKNIIDYRTHFFAPKKHFLGFYFDTYWFNVAVIWLMSILLYIALYFEWLKNLIHGTTGISKKFKYKDSN